MPLLLSNVSARTKCDFFITMTECFIIERIDPTITIRDTLNISLERLKGSMKRNLIVGTSSDGRWYE